MLFKRKVVSFMSALIFAGTTYASQEVCPNLSEIKAEGLNMAISVFGVYVVANTSTYNTNSNWGFGMLPIVADSDDEALETGNDILSNMSAPGVLGYDDDNTLFCSYETGVPGVFAIAAQQEFLNPMKLRQYILKLR